MEELLTVKTTLESGRWREFAAESEADGLGRIDTCKLARTLSRALTPPAEPRSS